MSTRIRIVSPGTLATIQDQGRFGYRRIGVPQSGVLHADLAWVANKLAKNPANTALIEFFFSGPTLRLEEGMLRLALTGDFSAELTRDKIKRTLKSWRTVTLEAGDTLQIGPVMSGKAGYIAISGGLDLPQVMGSCATYLRGGFGGLDGRKLLPDSLLSCLHDTIESDPDQQLPQWADLTALGLIQSPSEVDFPNRIRVIMGPQDDYFIDAARHDFLTGTYKVSRESDRMGSRLEGPTLVHHPDKKPEIISDGIVPGAIQVPGNGVPIVLLADGPTVGGYPKIATASSVDLPRLAVMPPGSQVRFEAITPEAAEALLLAHRKKLVELITTIEPLALTGIVDMKALYNTSLISGVMDALTMPTNSDSHENH
ncbi:MAG: biotin-dependent carboxyltransferase family protein [Desulfuromusa sp.]|nr:biotin-dependent carboxyltransferase family protein [Desulfuromusa sp.]